MGRRGGEWGRAGGSSARRGFWWWQAGRTFFLLPSSITSESLERTSGVRHLHPSALALAASAARGASRASASATITASQRSAIVSAPYPSPPPCTCYTVRVRRNPSASARARSGAMRPRDGVRRTQVATGVQCDAPNAVRNRRSPAPRQISSDISRVGTRRERPVRCVRCAAIAPRAPFRPPIRRSAVTRLALRPRRPPERGMAPAPRTQGRRLHRHPRAKRNHPRLQCTCTAAHRGHDRWVTLHMPRALPCALPS